jgi:hypothetical protein
MIDTAARAPVQRAASQRIGELARNNLSKRNPVVGAGAANALSLELQRHPHDAQLANTCTALMNLAKLIIDDGSTAASTRWISQHAVVSARGAQGAQPRVGTPPALHRGHHGRYRSGNSSCTRH